jgi:hypothetical protein
MATFEDNSKEVHKLFDRISRSTERRLDETAREVARKFFDNVRQEQPIGKTDPLHALVPGLKRPDRPSIRLHNEPIEMGWIAPVVSAPTPTRRLIELKSRSPHVIYFTRWTGRSHLGIRDSAQTAKNAEALFFAWEGIVWKKRSVGAHGFEPDDDFLQVAYDRTKIEVEPLIRNLARLSVEEA